MPVTLGGWWDPYPCLRCGRATELRRLKRGLCPRCQREERQEARRRQLRLDQPAEGREPTDGLAGG